MKKPGEHCPQGSRRGRRRSQDVIDAVALADESVVAVSVLNRDRNTAHTVRVQLDPARPAATSATLRLLAGDLAGEVLCLSERPVSLAEGGRSCEAELPPGSLAAVLLR